MQRPPRMPRAKNSSNLFHFSRLLGKNQESEWACVHLNTLLWSTVCVPAHVGTNKMATIESWNAKKVAQLSSELTGDQASSPRKLMNETKWECLLTRQVVPQPGPEPGLGPIGHIHSELPFEHHRLFRPYQPQDEWPLAYCRNGEGVEREKQKKKEWTCIEQIFSISRTNDLIFFGVGKLARWECNVLLMATLPSVTCFEVWRPNTQSYQRQMFFCWFDSHWPTKKNN